MGDHTDYTIAIAGPGAMGMLLAARLAASGSRVFLIDHRDVRARRLNDRGIKVEEPDGGTTHIKVPVVCGPTGLDEADCLVLLMKSWQSQAAFPMLARGLRRDALVLCLQNGMGHHLYLCRAVAPGKVALGVTSQGATRLDEGRVRHAGVGPTVIGPVDGRAPLARLHTVARLLSRAGWECGVARDIWPHVWKKLFINVGINALTAITGVKNGELLAFPELSEIQELAVKEACNVAEASGIQRHAPEDVLEAVRQVCRATAGNRSSMLQDVMAGRPTEIDYINGAVAKMGSRLGVATPINAALTEMVRGMTTRGLSPPLLAPRALKQKVVCGI